MSTTELWATACPFWDASLLRAAVTLNAVETEPVSMDRARNVQPTLTATVRATVIMDSAETLATLRATARALHRVTCASTDSACALGAVAEQYICGGIQYGNGSDNFNPFQSNESNSSRDLTIDHTLFRFGCVMPMPLSLCFVWLFAPMVFSGADRIICNQ